MKVFNPVDYLGDGLSIEKTELSLPDKNVAFLVNYLFDVGKRKECGGSVQLNLNIAHRIAFAEAFERKCFLSLNEQETLALEVNKYPTTCGFAAGFESEKTKLRAIAEAVERWAWEKIVDENEVISEIPIIAEDNLSSFLMQSFDKVKGYSKTMDFTFDNRNFKATLLIALGFTKEGVFPGSRVVFGEKKNFQHALLEAWRHLKIALKNEINNDDLIDQRIIFFSKNRKVAEDLFESHSLQQGNEDKPLNPKIKFVKPVFNDGSIFVYRALCEEFWGWDKGDESRFIY